MSSKLITKDVLRRLALPKKGSHKGDNGRLLVIAGNEQYHGSLLYAVKIASRIVDLVYVLSTVENQKLIRRLKGQTAEFIPVGDPSLNPSPFKGREDGGVDCVLIGPGMGVSKRTKELVRKVLKSGVKAVLDADALNVLDNNLLKMLGPQHILTPHQREFERLLAKVATSPFFPPLARGGRGNSREEVKRFMKRYHCTVVLKGPVDLVATPTGKIYENHTGNAGMTKGGTGDVLAGLIAALYCLPAGDHPKGDTNDALTAAAAGVFINGLAGDELYKKVGTFYNAEDLAEQVGKTMWRLLKAK